MDPKREMLRHSLSTLAYRAGKALRGAPETFADYASPDASKAPVRIVAHVGDLLDWALSMADGSRRWFDSTPLPWDQEVARFYASLSALDAYLASSAELKAPPERLFQGPIADALTHTGQLAMLRRMSGDAIKSENYFVADIVIGRVGVEQTPPKRES